MGVFSTPQFPSVDACRLLQAAEIGSLSVVEECLRAGVDAKATDVNGHSALHKCAFMGFWGVASALIAADSTSVHAQDLMLNTPLHAAAFSGHAVGIKLQQHL